jgi:hypothetical protein
MPTRQQLSALRDYQCFVRHRRQRGCRVMASAVNGPPTRDTSIDILPPRMQRYLRIALPRLHAVRSERAHHGARPLCADIVAKVENRTTQKISRKLVLGLLCCCIACQRRNGGPWSILDETIWSLTSPLIKRISGSKNFRSSPQKDFFNNIRQKRSLDILIHGGSGLPFGSRLSLQLWRVPDGRTDITTRRALARCTILVICGRCSTRMRYRDAQT